MRYDLRAMSVGAILDRALRIYVRHFWMLLAISLVFSVPMASLYFFIAASARPDPMDQTVITLFGSMVYAGIVVAFLQGTLVQAVSDIYLGIPASLGRSLRLAVSRSFPLLVGTFLYTALTTLGMMACILPGLFLTGALCAVIPIVVLEHRGPIDAISRSWELTSGMRRRAFATVFFSQLQVAFVAYAIALPAGAMQAPPLQTQALTHVVTALVQPYMAIVLILLYYDLRVRREAFDLQVLAVELGRTPSPPPATPAP